MRRERHAAKSLVMKPHYKMKVEIDKTKYNRKRRNESIIEQDQVLLQEESDY